jgi:hypothetical protein
VQGRLTAALLQQAEPHTGTRGTTTHTTHPVLHMALTPPAACELQTTSSSLPRRRVHTKHQDTTPP